MTLHSINADLKRNKQKPPTTAQIKQQKTEPAQLISAQGAKKLLRHLPQAPFVQMVPDEDGDIFYDALEEPFPELFAEHDGGLSTHTLRFF